MKTDKLYFNFALSAVLCLIVLAIAPIKDTFREWKKYQKEFYRQEAGKKEDAHNRKFILNTPIEIKQILINKLGRVDRCITCHISIENPNYSNAKQPLKNHPGKFLKQHSIEKFGCTVCHRGQGRATTVKAAHGESEWWEEPLLPGDYVYGTCSKCHTEAQISNPFYTQGRRLFNELGCIGCHIVNKEGGTIGPELTGVGSRRKADWLFKHLKNPQKTTAGSIMPKIDSSDDEIRALVLFLFGLSEEEIPYEYKSLKIFEETTKIVKYADSIEAGKAIFEKYGCAGCHGKIGKGGVRNPNSVGDLVPAIVFVAENYTKKELKEFILRGATAKKENPQHQTPPLFMPAWKGKIGDKDLNSLIDYLYSLYPKDEKMDW